MSPRRGLSFVLHRRFESSSDADPRLQCPLGGIDEIYGLLASERTAEVVVCFVACLLEIHKNAGDQAHLGGKGRSGKRVREFGGNFGPRAT
jgi:hypothetical protein